MACQWMPCSYNDHLHIGATQHTPQYHVQYTCIKPHPGEGSSHLCTVGAWGGGGGRVKRNLPILKQKLRGIERRRRSVWFLSMNTFEGSSVIFFLAQVNFEFTWGYQRPNLEKCLISPEMCYYLRSYYSRVLLKKKHSIAHGLHFR